LKGKAGQVYILAMHSRGITRRLHDWSRGHERGEERQRDRKGSMNHVDLCKLA
jgi:hypothetical protein